MKTAAATFAVMLAAVTFHALGSKLVNETPSRGKELCSSLETIGNSLGTIGHSLGTIGHSFNEPAVAAATVLGDRLQCHRWAPAASSPRLLLMLNIDPAPDTPVYQPSHHSYASGPTCSICMHV